MFEIIGMVVVAWVGWVVLKTVLGLLGAKVMRQSIEIAMQNGVPEKVAIGFARQPALLKSALEYLAGSVPRFSALSQVEQYARAITSLHVWGKAGGQAAHGLRAAPAADGAKPGGQATTAAQIKGMVALQVAKLESEGVEWGIDYITFVYVGALALSLSNKPASLDEIKGFVEHSFDDKYALDIDLAWDVVLTCAHFTDDLAAMLPVAQREVRAGSGDYLVRYMRKFQPGAIAQGAPRDPSKVSDTWFLDV